MRKSFLMPLALASASVVSTPALADEPYAVTPSGATEAYFAKPIVETSDYLANQCVDLGWTMVSSTATAVICEVPVSFGQRLLSALAGPRYATPPRQYFRFNLTSSSGNTRVQASSWQEIQTAFGQTQRTDLASENYHNTVMDFFEKIGGVYPPGTRFPNHVSVGSGFVAREKPEAGLELLQVEDRGAFSRAGLEDGDVVTKIAGERVKGYGDIYDALHKAVKNATYTVEYRRSGSKLTATVERTYRPEYTDRLPELLAADPVPNSTLIQQAALSPADELSKFAKLRDDGIITAEEFEAQKAKILSGN